MKPKILVRGIPVLTLAVVLIAGVVWAEDDYEFMPADGWGGKAETGEDDASTRLAEGFEGFDGFPTKDTWIEPVDGSGGYDLGPRLPVEEGPGGLEWDPSPTYRTRYKGPIDYPAGSSQLQGNNWFTNIPYATFDSGTNQYRVRFDANTFRVYTNVDASTWRGRYGNTNSIIKKIGNDLFLYDTRGKVYFFSSTYGLKCARIDGLGGNRIDLDYGQAQKIVVSQKDSTATEVRRITYILNTTSTRIDKIDIEEINGGTPTRYRRIDFTYFEEVINAIDGVTGDLIGVEDMVRLSSADSVTPCADPQNPDTCDSGWSKRRWIYKYYTTTDGSETGYRYQVRAIIGPESYRRFKQAQGSANIYTWTIASLEGPPNYIDQKYEYFADRRPQKIILKGSCGCGGGEGDYVYDIWDVKGTAPTSFNTWYHRVKIRMSNGSYRMVDYNIYGQAIHWIAQEAQGLPNPPSGSRRWIRKWNYSTTGWLTFTWSFGACDSYDDASHTVSTNNTHGQRLWYAKGANETLQSLRLRNPTTGVWNYQVWKTFNLYPSGDRRRILKTQESLYPEEGLPSTSGVDTTYTYSFHIPDDPLAVSLRTTTLPAVPSTENGSGSAVVLKDWFEKDGLHTWSKDGDDPTISSDGFVHYTKYDPNRRAAIMRVVNINTSSPPPNTDPPPHTDFSTTSGLNLVTEWVYDRSRRMTKEILPGFNAFDGINIIADNKITRQWYYLRLTNGELLTSQSPHIDSAYHHAAMQLSVYDLSGNLLISALGELSSGTPPRNNDLADDFQSTLQPTLEQSFNGTIVRRTDYTYDGDNLKTEEVWTVATNPGATKYVTQHSYDAAGRREKTVNPVGTITRWTFDKLDRVKETKIGTDDLIPGNMTKVEERFYDDEEDGTPDPNSRGSLTQVLRFTSCLNTNYRQTDYLYYYRSRVVDVREPGNVKELKTYNNLGQVKVVERHDNAPVPSKLMAKSENIYDKLGRVYEARTYGVLSDGTISGYTNVKTWYNGRGQVIKTKSRGKVLEKTQYDGAGRVTLRAVSYDTGELDTDYAAAGNLTNDSVFEETRYTNSDGSVNLDGLGGEELVKRIERKQGATGTGPLTIPGNGWPQFTARWFDEFHREKHDVNYGDNGNVDMNGRPVGLPPSTSSSTSLVWHNAVYTVKGELQENSDAEQISTYREYDDSGRLVKLIENFDDGIFDPLELDKDRVTEFTYNGLNQKLTVIRRKATYQDATYGYIDHVSEYEYGIACNQDHSEITSNDLLKLIKFPDPDDPPGVDPPGSPSNDPNDQKLSGYNAQGEIIWQKDQRGVERELERDARGRVINDRVLNPGPVTDPARRIARNFDALDRLTATSTWDNSVPEVAMNEVKLTFERYSVISTIEQENDGLVNAGSKKVQYAHLFPTAGESAVRRTLTTYHDGTVVTDEYKAGDDDNLSRLSGRKRSGAWVFEDFYQGLSRLVQRKFGTSTTADWNLSLDRFGRPTSVWAISNGTYLNGYSYTYNFNSMVTYRDDWVGKNAYGSDSFDEDFTYDGHGRMLQHRRGILPNNPDKTEIWKYDPAGNITEYSTGAPSTFTFNASNEITARNGDAQYASYDDAGNMTRKEGGPSGQGYTNQFDAWDRLVEVLFNASTIAKYEPNGLGLIAQRLEPQYSNRVTNYYSGAEGAVLVEEIAGSPTFLVWGSGEAGDLVARGTNDFYVQDAFRSTVSRLNSSGYVIHRYVYDGYGFPSQLSPDWLTWTTITEDLYLFSGLRFFKEQEQYCSVVGIFDPELGTYLEENGKDEENENPGRTVVGNPPQQNPGTIGSPGEHDSGKEMSLSQFLRNHAACVIKCITVVICAHDDSEERGKRIAKKYGVDCSYVDTIQQLEELKERLRHLPCTGVKKLIFTGHGWCSYQWLKAHVAGIHADKSKFLLVTQQLQVSLALSGIKWCIPCNIVFGGCRTGSRDTVGNSLIHDAAMITPCSITGNLGEPSLGGSNETENPITTQRF